MTTEMIPLPHFHSGKVRDTYELPNHPELLLMVSSDRISTHNVKHCSLVPNKGLLLNALTIFWTFDVLADVQTHLVAYGADIVRYLPPGAYPADLQYRAVVVHRHTPEPREFIWRNYLTGSLYKACRDPDPKKRDPYGLLLPSGLPKLHRFTPAIFTPTRKSENDEPVRSRYARRQYPESTRLTQKVFGSLTDFLQTRGITLIDGKFEAEDGVLLDEWGTGDCSRMAWTKDVHEGVDPPWLDKEYFRQAAERAWGNGPKQPLAFDEETTREGAGKYHEAFEAITGSTLEEFKRKYLD